MLGIRQKVPLLLHQLPGHILLSRIAINVCSLFTKTGKWEEKFTKDVRIELESFWKDKVFARCRQDTVDDVKPKFYVLSMFPYPSGKLHMGHVRVYAISDAMARYHRLTGKNVVHPMGWDAFGLPAENAAFERGEDPDEWTYSNIRNMKQQMKDLCCDFDWERELATCDPEYYKWTQFIFLKMYEAGLVYQREAPVNWDPVDLTVLADEQIDDNGRSWRSGAVVEKKLLKQWYIRTTAYSKSLLDGLNSVNPELWRDIISLQQNWIGSCDGIRFEFKLQSELGSHDIPESVSLFTKRPEAIFGISHISLSKDHSLNKDQYYKNASTESSEDIRLNVVAVHPFSHKKIPLFVETNREFEESLDAHIGIPSCNESDLKFVQLHKLDFVDVLDAEQGVIINSDKFSGLSFQDAYEKVVNAAKEIKCGGHITSGKTRDWLISRQRYWGTPIPIIHCKKYGAVPVAYEDLPIVLPKVKNFRSHGKSPLTTAEDWLKAKCPKCDCDGYGERETDTMDTFVDSSWYYLRYLDPKNSQEPFSRETASQFMPVDLYIGGKEHAILHLYYARFFSHFLHDLGLIPTPEPFVNLLTQGMVMGQSFRFKSTGKYIPPHEVELKGNIAVHRDSGEPVETQWEKMSKSKYNGVDPEAVLKEFGTDSTRLCILSNVAPKTDRPWSNDAFIGILRWQNRIWSLVSEFVKQKKLHKDNSSQTTNTAELKQIELEIRDARNYFLLEVSFHMNRTFLLNTAISRLQGLTNALRKVSADGICNSFEFERSLAELVVMLYPFAPMFASELWSGLASVASRNVNFQWSSGIENQKWPEVDEDYCPPMHVKVNGKDVFDVRLPMPYKQMGQLTTEQALTLVKKHQDFDHLIGSRPLLRHQLNIYEHYKVDFEINIVDKKLKKKQRTNV